jgi:hypothetical protein
VRENITRNRSRRRCLPSVSHPLNLHQYSPITSFMTVSRLLVSHNLERSVTRRQLLYVRSEFMTSLGAHVLCASEAAEGLFHLKRACTSRTVRGDLPGGIFKRARIPCCFQVHPCSVIPNTAASCSISDRFSSTRGRKP